MRREIEEVKASERRLEDRNRHLERANANLTHTLEKERHDHARLRDMWLGQFLLMNGEESPPSDNDADAGAQ